MQAADVPHVIFNQREAFFSDLLLEQRNGRWHGSLWARETLWPLDRFTGIYTRLIPHLSLPENQQRGRQKPDSEAIAHSALIHTMLADWVEMAECRVLNRGEAMASNGSKPYQAQWIRRAGFLVPPTIVTNDPDLAVDFARQYGQVIYKSTSSVRSIVQPFNPNGNAPLNLLHNLPVQFQARIIGTNIRVHVVGERVFATEILSEAVDYRYAAETVMRCFNLPPEVESRCVQLSKMLRLPLCGIDLMRTSAGDFYCFEVNPSPAYSYFENQSNQPISSAIVAYLSNVAA